MTKSISYLLKVVLTVALIPAMSLGVCPCVQADTADEISLQSVCPCCQENALVTSSCDARWENTSSIAVVSSSASNKPVVIADTAIKVTSSALEILRKSINIEPPASQLPLYLAINVLRL